MTIPNPNRSMNRMRKMMPNWAFLLVTGARCLGAGEKLTGAIRKGNAKSGEAQIARRMARGKKEKAPAQWQPHPPPWQWPPPEAEGVSEPPFCRMP